MKPIPRGSENGPIITYETEGNRVNTSAGPRRSWLSFSVRRRELLLLVAATFVNEFSWPTKGRRQKD